MRFLRAVRSTSIRPLNTKLVKLIFLLDPAKGTMAFTEQEKDFIQKQDVLDFSSYLKSAWHTWPSLRYNQVRRKASKLWKARKHWLKTLEPTSALKKCHCSLHQIWSPLVEGGHFSKTVLTVTSWEPILDEPQISCWGCKENQPNQLAHMDYGGCLVEPFEDMSALPPLPASPPSTD